MFIDSPFINQIAQCKSIMRRLRKKISKYIIAHKQMRKPRDQTHDVINILKTRNLPSFIFDTFKKRRTLDFLTLKNIVMNGQSNLDQMKKLTNHQQNQIQFMFVQHKKRLRKSKDKIIPKFQRRQTNYSSTQQDDISDFVIDQEDQDILDESILEKEQNIEHSIRHHERQFQEDGPTFHGKDFLSFRDDVYSEDQWLKF